MQTEHKLTTVKTMTSKAMLKPAPAVLSAEEREEKIQYLVNYFRLTFRTDLAYAEFMRECEEIDEAEAYDETVMLNYSTYARCGSDEEMEEYHEEFKALGAEEKFLECCIDYYKDVNVELKFNRHKVESKLKLLAKEEQALLPFDKKKKRWIRNRRRPLEANLDLVLRKKKEVEKKLSDLYNALKTLKESKNQTEVIK